MPIFDTVLLATLTADFSDPKSHSNASTAAVAWSGRGCIVRFAMTVSAVGLLALMLDRAV